MGDTEKNFIIFWEYSHNFRLLFLLEAICIWMRNLVMLYLRISLTNNKTLHLLAHQHYIIISIRTLKRLCLKESILNKELQRLEGVCFFCGGGKVDWEVICYICGIFKGFSLFLKERWDRIKTHVHLLKKVIVMLWLFFSLNTFFILVI